MILPLLFLFLFSVSSSQTPPDTGITVIHAGRLFDSEKGKILEKRDIIIHDQVIDTVGENLPIPLHAREINLSNYTVLPGLIDAHTHLLYHENPSDDITSEGTEAIIFEGSALRALHGAARARTFLHAGITTVRDLGNSGLFNDVALKQGIDDGSVNGPRMQVSGPGLSSEGGQFPGLQQKFKDIAEEEYRIVHGVEDASAAVTENITYGADLIKIYSNNTPNKGALSVDEIKAIVERAKLFGVRVAAHATNNAAVWRAAIAGVNSIEHAYRVEDTTLQLMLRKGIALVATDFDSTTAMRYVELQPVGKKNEVALGMARVVKIQRDRLMRAYKAGVMIIAGSDQYLDLQMSQGEAAKHVLFAYAEAGMPFVDILRSASINAAKLLGWENKVGVIKPGAWADIIAVEGNPEIDIKTLENIRFVMKAGTVYR
jgi:imidazolonepropionase-like amidohydrolase